MRATFTMLLLGLAPVSFAYQGSAQTPEQIRGAVLDPRISHAKDYPGTCDIESPLIKKVMKCDHVQVVFYDHNVSIERIIRIFDGSNNYISFFGIEDLKGNAFINSVVIELGDRQQHDVLGDCLFPGKSINCELKNKDGDMLFKFDFKLKQ